jgi:hypothetical protein
MKTASNIILGCLWVFGLIMAGGSINSEAPFSYQIFVCIGGVAVFSISSWGIIINNRG